MAADRVRLDLALVHEPVVNRRGERIGSAVTNLDLHDIARACRTYGVETYWLVTPYPRQQELVRDLAAHWLTGPGRLANPDRGEALSLIRISDSLEQTAARVREKWGPSCRLFGTSARPGSASTGYARLRGELRQGCPILLVFGTAWGLAPEAVQLLDGMLPPIDPGRGYNHLSVRSAVAVVLDRLLGERAA